MASIFKFATSSGAKKKEPRYACQKKFSNSLVREPPPNKVPMERDAPSPEPIIYPCIGYIYSINTTNNWL
jgi:hypothetical protein